MTTLAQKRKDVLDHISENYNFGESEVKAMDGWMTEEPGFEYTRVVYLENLEEPSRDIELVYLRVFFESETSENLKDVYAIDRSGNIFGSYEK